MDVCCHQFVRQEGYYQSPQGKYENKRVRNKSTDEGRTLEFLHIRNHERARDKDPYEWYEMLRSDDQLASAFRTHNRLLYHALFDRERTLAHRTMIDRQLQGQVLHTLTLQIAPETLQVLPNPVFNLREGFVQVLQRISDAEAQITFSIVAERGAG
jgi:hypothetical protein